MLNSPAENEKRLQKQNLLSRWFLIVFAITFCAYLPALLTAAKAADDKFRGTVSDGGDGHQYQELAINLLYGKGFADGIVMPLETYHFDLTTPAGIAILDRYEEHGPDQPLYTFYRSPGLPALLAGLYAVFGNYTLVTRQALAVMAWLTAILMLLVGMYLDNWRGILAGGVVGILYLTFYVLLRPRDPFFESIMAERPATFIFVSAGFFFVMYLKRQRLRDLILVAFFLAATIFSRPNFVATIPFLLLYLFLRKRTIRDVAVFSAVLLLPLVVWSAYAGQVRRPDYPERIGLSGV